MNNKNEQKKRWFTKKEVTTPLGILNKLLDLEGDKRLRLKPTEKKTNLGKSKKTSPEQLSTERKKREEESKKREEESKKRQTDRPDVKKIVDNKQIDVKTNGSIVFHDIDEQYQEKLNFIIPQLNEIYLAINKENKGDTEENVVHIITKGMEDGETTIESQKSIYVDEYIPPIKVS